MSQSQLDREEILSQDSITASLHSSQLHDYGFGERKRYGRLNNASDIFNRKEEEDEDLHHKGALLSKSKNHRKYQHHHYQLTSPFGRDDLTMDNKPSFNTNNSEDVMTEPNNGLNSEKSTMEGGSHGGGSRRRVPGTGHSSSTIERDEDIFVSREDLQTKEERKESLLKRQQLDQLLNNDNESNSNSTSNPNPTSNQKYTYSSPFATSFDLANNDKKVQKKSSTLSVTRQAPFGTDEDIPKERLESSSQRQNASSTGPSSSNMNTTTTTSTIPTYDKATALSDRNYFNKIMNDHHRPEASPEDLKNQEKFQEAKNRFDIMATDDLKNHPEVIEELNRISATDSKESSHKKQEAPKEAIYHSLEDLDKKLEKISFDPSAAKASGATKSQLHCSEGEVEYGDACECNCTCNGVDGIGIGHATELNFKNFNESHIFDTEDEKTAPVPPQDQKGRTKVSSSFNHIFGPAEVDPEAEKKEMENRQLYSRRHRKLAQQNHSDIFCLGGEGEDGGENQKGHHGLSSTNEGGEQLTTVSRRSTQLNLQTSNDNPMLTTYGSMNNSIHSYDRHQMANQPAHGLPSKQFHPKAKSRKFAQTKSSQILF